MFGFRKKTEEMHKDPKKALEHADKTLNTGFTGWISKTVMGDYFHSEANKGIKMAKQFTDNGNLSVTGTPATAEVISLQDTGKLVNFNPVLMLKLKVLPQFGTPFEIETEATVSKIAVPKAGDKLNIKYNPANTKEIIIL
ncbi:MAG: hypothetical protein N2510_06140 [Ignavibacteria bacterium]|nr:hypothetical protein [Ignavibacteria bacterium]